LAEVKAVAVEQLGRLTLAEYQSTSMALGYLCTPADITSLLGRSHARGAFTFTKTTRSTPESVLHDLVELILGEDAVVARWMTTTSPSCPDAAARLQDADRVVDLHADLRVDYRKPVYAFCRLPTAPSITESPMALTLP
jgi:hypothetical protein